jgi:molecular chaperone DnaK/molecular chaperone HscA
LRASPPTGSPRAGGVDDPESFDHAEEDLQQRQLIEARREAETIFARWTRLLASCLAAIDFEETEQIRLARQLEALIPGQELKALSEATDAMDKATDAAELMWIRRLPA